ncbi:MAG: UDP-N-acetylmuramoyl-tripeptide--D-alanyl-D-alanine ligase [Thermomicrobiales bacterium]|nr:UDP-N-acetylmuramoyl-tripeptide--D-alanyl-D-alanine ligase [Thermomicrobiales bacterium]
MPLSATSRTAPPIPLAEVLDATGADVIGDLPPKTEFRWIERNSREVVPGDLFIAVKGEVHDGHVFVSDAAAHGATAALVRTDWAAEQAAPPIPLIAVADPVEALQQLAAARRRRLPIEIVGVTGSLGKTSAKETIAAVLGARYRTYRSPGNMNSEIGLPLSILEIEPDIEMAVLEMGGAYAMGEVALLARIAGPKVGVVTNVHPIHLERMGSIEAIAETKRELPASLSPSGFAVLNGDDVRVRAMAAYTRATVLTYGSTSENTVWFSGLETFGNKGIAFDLHGIWPSRRIELPLAGAHSVELVMAALLTGHAFGLELDEMLEPLRNREVQVRLVPVPGPNGALLIDDTYNASAPSMLTALRVLTETDAKRRIAVLGGMRELGSETDAQHRVVGEAAGRSVDKLYTYGELALKLAGAAIAASEVDGNSLSVQSFHEDQREELIAALLSELSDGDLVLLKGSRGLEMERIVKALESPAKGSQPSA